MGSFKWIGRLVYSRFITNKGAINYFEQFPRSDQNIKRFENVLEIQNVESHYIIWIGISMRDNNNNNNKSYLYNAFLRKDPKRCNFAATDESSESRRFI